ncbi:hypothetical protein GCM10023195_01680 [Actinoallomurus liliacearum]|uniref:Secreted protein n=1 Tax=Actinoallomurus liliacearum TaxID=1080073 RepID=A0ABP8T8T8_9ACTN
MAAAVGVAAVADPIPAPASPAPIASTTHALVLVRIVFLPRPIVYPSDRLMTEGNRSWKGRQADPPDHFMHSRMTPATARASPRVTAVICGPLERVGRPHPPNDREQ